MRLITQTYKNVYITNHTRKELVGFKIRYSGRDEGLLVKVLSFLPGVKDIYVNGWASFRNMECGNKDDITAYIDNHNFNLEEYLNKGYVLK